MDLQVGRDRPDQPRQPQVLDDHRIDTRRDQLANRALDVSQLVGKDQRIERDVAAHPPTVQQRHDLGQIGPVEVHRPDAGIVPAETEVNGIGPILDRGQQARPIPRWREQFRLETDFKRRRLLSQ